VVSAHEYADELEIAFIERGATRQKCAEMITL
jgi:hypothetical protein